MKVRELIRILDANGTFLRITGSHGMWKLPNGTVLPIVVSSKNSDVSRYVMAHARKAFRACGLEDLLS